MLREPVGDGGHEAYTVIVWGGILSRERKMIAEVEAVDVVEDNMSSAVMRGAVALPWSKTPSRTKGTGRNLGYLATDRAASRLPGPRREGEEP